MKRAMMSPGEEAWFYRAAGIDDALTCRSASRLAAQTDREFSARQAGD